MLNWLSSNLSTILISIVLLAIVISIIRYLINQKAGKKHLRRQLRRRLFRVLRLRRQVSQRTVNFKRERYGSTPYRSFFVRQRRPSPFHFR